MENYYLKIKCYQILYNLNILYFLFYLINIIKIINIDINNFN